MCEFALSVVVGLELSGAGVYWNDTGLGVLRLGLTGWRVLRRRLGVPAAGPLWVLWVIRRRVLAVGWYGGAGACEGRAVEAPAGATRKLAGVSAWGDSDVVILQCQRLIRLRRKYPENVQIARFDSVSAALTDSKKAKMEVKAASLSVGPWPASIVGLGAGARRRVAQLQLPAHPRNKTRGGLRRVHLGAAVVTGGTDAVTDTSATASAVHLPAMSPGGDVVVVLEDLPASRAFPAAAGGFGRRETVSGGV